MKNPEDVVREAFAAINMEDWHGLTALCDPLSLAVFKKQQVDFIADLAESYEIASDDPEFDAMEKIRYAADQNFFIRREVAGISSLDELREMDPARVFVRWLQARSPSHWDLDLDDLEPQRANVDESRGKKRIVNYRYTVLGSVSDGPDISYVLFRPTETALEIYPEAYGEAFKKFTDDERRFVVAMHHRGDPVVVICRRQSDGSWLIVAKRNFFLMDSLEIVEVRRREGG